MMGKRSSVVAMKTVTSRPVLFLWMSVSLAVALLCSWSYSQPAWTVRASSEVASLYQQHRRPQRAVTIELTADDPVVEQREDVPATGAKNRTTATTARAAIPLVHIGLFAMCVHTNTPRHPDGTATCVSHAELDYDWLPPAWQVTRVVCAGGCLLLLACAAASVGVAFVRHHQRQQSVIKTTAIAQLAAATLMLVGLCFYPFGLRNENLHQFCDERCQPGWASLVAGMASAAAFLCPVIASLVADPIYDANPWEAYLLL